MMRESSCTVHINTTIDIYTLLYIFKSTLIGKVHQEVGGRGVQGESPGADKSDIIQRDSLQSVRCVIRNLPLNRKQKLVRFNLP